MSRIEKSKQFNHAMSAFAATSTTMSDKQALAMTSLFPTWEEVLSLGEELAAGKYIRIDTQLYHVEQNVTPIESQPPDAEGMLAIYRPVDAEHEGTLEDPIPWVYGMDCLETLYYSYNDHIYMVAEGGSMIPCTWAPDSGIWQWVLIQ